MTGMRGRPCGGDATEAASSAPLPIPPTTKLAAHQPRPRARPRPAPHQTCQLRARSAAVMPREGDAGIAARQIRLLARERKEGHAGETPGKPPPTRPHQSRPPPSSPPTNPVLEPAPLQARPIPYSATAFTSPPSPPQSTAIKRMDRGEPSNPSPLSSDPPIHSRSFHLRGRPFLHFSVRHSTLLLIMICLGSCLFISILVICYSQMWIRMGVSSSFDRL
jgi:hypothetical protein